MRENGVRRAISGPPSGWAIGAPAGARVWGMGFPNRRDVSMEFDVAAVHAAEDVLGTRTPGEAVDAALTEVVTVRQREALLEVLSTPGALELENPDVMAGAWRCEGPD